MIQESNGCKPRPATPKIDRILFTDPACLGEGGFYTSTGDVDDVAAAIYMARRVGSGLTMVICDDDASNSRYTHFLQFLGNDLIRLYGVTIIPEKDFPSSDMKGSRDRYMLHFHAPCRDETIEFLKKNPLPMHSYRQGDDSAMNFRKSDAMKSFFSSLSDEQKTTFNTADTRFVVEKTWLTNENLPTHKTVRRVYDNFFIFQMRKMFGLAAHIPGLCQRLYSDTGLDGGPGNGVKSLLPVFEELRRTGKFKPVSSILAAAIDNTLPPGHEIDESVSRNVKDIVALLDLYCDFELLLVDGYLPNMSNLGEVKKRKDVDSIVIKAIEANESTPLYDFAASVYAIKGDCDDTELHRLLQECLDRFDQDLIFAKE